MALNGRSKSLASFAVIVMAAIVSAIIIVPQLVNATETGDTDLTIQTSDATETATQETIFPAWSNKCMDFGRHCIQFGMRDFGGLGAIQVSDEFKQRVTGIAENDTHVQNLINDSYNFTSVNPIVQTIINGDGTPVTKATSTVLTLQKDTTGHATVMVNIEEVKVTQIVILTRTIIDKH
jgi:hypothetical protein